jgi:anti-sigma regulatory factor (Ser/Thr protein kinase)
LREMPDLLSDTAQGWCASIAVPSRLEYLRPASQFIVQASLAMGVSRAAEPLFEVAIVEALSNAFRHGSHGLDGSTILCELAIVADRFLVRVFDNGPGFALAEPQPPPDWTAADIDVIPAWGFGVPIIRAVFPDVQTIRRSGQFGLEMALPFS